MLNATCREESSLEKVPTLEFQKHECDGARARPGSPVLGIL